MQRGDPAGKRLSGASAQRPGLNVQFYLRRVLVYLPTLSGFPEELKDCLPEAWKRHLMAEQRSALDAQHIAMVRVAIEG